MPRPTPLGRSARSRRTLVAVSIAAVLVAACGSPGPSPAPAASPASALSPAPASSAATSTPGGPSLNPSPSLSPASASPAAPIDEAAVYRQIEDQVIALRGLPAKQRLEPTILDEAQLRVRIEAQFRAENPPAEIAASQATLVAMGLLPAGTSLADLYVNLLGSQVAGYYDPDSEADLRRRADGPDRGDREGHLRPRVHPRAPGPELRAEGDHHGHRRAG